MLPFYSRIVWIVLDRLDGLVTLFPGWGKSPAANAVCTAPGFGPVLRSALPTVLASPADDPLPADAEDMAILTDLGGNLGLGGWDCGWCEFR